MIWNNCSYQSPRKCLNSVNWMVLTTVILIYSKFSRCFNSPFFLMVLSKNLFNHIDRSFTITVQRFLITVDWFSYTRRASLTSHNNGCNSKKISLKKWKCCLMHSINWIKHEIVEAFDSLIPIRKTNSFEYQTIATSELCLVQVKKMSCATRDANKL